MALRAQAQARQLTLELLLGEPTWVLPHERARLLALVESLRDLPDPEQLDDAGLAGPSGAMEG